MSIIDILYFEDITPRFVIWNGFDMLFCAICALLTIVLGTHIVLLTILDIYMMTSKTI